MKEPPIVSLLFARGDRPRSHTVAAFVEGVPGVHAGFEREDAPDGGGLELLADGLTFDLTGLAPGKPAAPPPSGHTFGLSASAEGALQAVALKPGPHLAGAAGMPPVLRRLAQVAAQLSALPGTCAVCWHPARSWSTPRLFRDTVLGWIDGGPFPAFALAALAPTLEGGAQTGGLALFTGQELRIEPELARDRALAAEIAPQVIRRLSDDGPVRDAEMLIGDGRIPLLLEPSANRRFVRVWPAPPK